MKYTYTLILVLFGLTLQAQTLYITVTDKNNGNLMEAANVKILGSNMVNQTNKEGIVTFTNLKKGRFEIEISSVGYESKIINELFLESTKDLFVEVALQLDPKNLSEVTISAASTNISNTLVSMHEITSEQVYRYPVTFFDPARLAFSLPGVANTNDQANGMAIRGNKPDGMQWRLEGVEIVNPNHLSNAGTFSDKPTQTGGGVNILSAQMLGNMNFLTGAFPADYGNALSGVMDMRFKIGNNKKYEHTVQVGLIGIDLASEGPINKKKGSSYLINYRYSFTGLLGLMGVSFGGEKISFQDLAFNLNFPTKNLGTFNIFFMGGTSSNIFKPDSDPANWESEKDLTNIDFFNRMAAFGLKHKLNFKNGLKLSTTIANSGLDNLRSVYTLNPGKSFDYDYQAHNIVSVNTTLSGKLYRNISFAGGVTFNQYYNLFNLLNIDNQYYSTSQYLAQPYFRIQNSNLSKLSYNLGLHMSYYSWARNTFLEPRGALSYSFTPKTKLTAAYGLHSFQSNTRATFQNYLKPNRSHHFAVGAIHNINTNLILSTELFYQSIFNIPSYPNRFLSNINGEENVFIDNLSYNNLNQEAGRNYGIEINLKKYLENGLFAIINTTLYQSKFKAFDGIYYDSRFNGNKIINITLGKEWERSKNRAVGVNARIAWLGGFRSYAIEKNASAAAKTTVYDYTKPLTEKNPDYFRPDLRIYFKKSKAKTSSTFSVDIQNVSNTKNFAYNYYDSYLKAVTPKYQLGMLPMINYRIQF